MTLPTWGATAALTESSAETISVSVRAACTRTGNSVSSSPAATERKTLLRFCGRPSVSHSPTERNGVVPRYWSTLCDYALPRRLLRLPAHYLSANDPTPKRKDRTTARIYPSGAVNSGNTCFMVKSSILSFASGWRIANGASAADMLSAPKRCGAAGRASRTRSTKRRIGRKVTLVRLLTSWQRKVVAAATGDE